MSKDITWEELCEKAKEMGYRLIYDDGDIPYFDGNSSYYLENQNISLTFFKDGQIEYNYGGIIAENRTYNQMLIIMEALK